MRNSKQAAVGSPDLVDRNSFSGPGLAIRIAGDIKKEKLDLLRDVDAVYLDEIRKSGLYDEIWQAFAACCRCAPWA